MDIYITYWNSKGKRVEVRYYETDFMGHTTVQDIQHFLMKNWNHLVPRNYYKLEWMVLT